VNEKSASGLYLYILKSIVANDVFNLKGVIDLYFYVSHLNLTRKVKTVEGLISLLIL
jgi:hypothetical protein